MALLTNRIVVGASDGETTRFQAPFLRCIQSGGGGGMPVALHPLQRTCIMAYRQREILITGLKAYSRDRHSRMIPSLPRSSTSPETASCGRSRCVDSSTRPASESGSLYSLEPRLSATSSREPAWLRA